MRLLNALCMLFACFLHAFDVGMLRQSQLDTEPSPKAVLASLVQRLSVFSTEGRCDKKHETYETLTKLRSQLKGFIEFIILPHESSANPNWQATHRSLSQQKTNGKNYYFEV